MGFFLECLCNKTKCLSTVTEFLFKNYLCWTKALQTYGQAQGLTCRSVSTRGYILLDNVEVYLQFPIGVIL